MRRLLPISLPLVLALGASGPAHAAWLPDGVLVSGNSLGGGHLLANRAESGGWFVAWRSRAPAPSTDDYNLRLQRILDDGSIAPGWPANGVLVCEALGDRYPAGIVPDGLGGVVIGWNDARHWPAPNGWDIYLQRILPDGSIAPGWPANGLAAVASPNSEWLGDLEATPTHDIVLAWHTGSGAPQYSQGDPGPKSVHTVTRDGVAAPGWPPNGRIIDPLTRPDPPHLASDDSGGWFVAWADSHAANLNSTTAIRVDSLGLPHPEFGSATRRVAVPGGAVGLIPDGSGGVMIALADWRLRPVGYSAFPYMDVYTQHIGPDGAPLPGWPLDAKPICTEYFTQQDIQIIADGAGGAFMAWEDSRNIDSTASDIYVVRITGNGDPAPGWPLAGLRVARNIQPEWEPRIVANGLGGVYVSWVEYLPPYRVRAQHLLANGQVHPNWPPGGRFVTTAAHSTAGAVLAPAGSGNALICWSDGRQSAPGYYCLLLSDEDITAVQVALARLEATPDRVRLEWYASGDPIGVVTLERRSESSGWSARATLAPDGTGRIAFEDREVTPGSRWAYRLAYLDGDTPVTTPETWVDVPAAFELSLTGFRPNPLTTSAWSVEFSLAQRGPGALEVFDVAGRRVARHDLAGFAPGRHQLRLDPAASWRSGVYWVRLSHSGRSFTARGVVAQ